MRIRSRHCLRLPFLFFSLSGINNKVFDQKVGLDGCQGMWPLTLDYMSRLHNGEPNRPQYLGPTTLVSDKAAPAPYMLLVKSDCKDLTNVKFSYSMTPCALAHAHEHNAMK
ncbi:hypothetical protein TWF970_010813 [Orbilia oligospora]|uniref:Uncharacterized protein n=1 Tax=Orbilia oligospora TaxID=2813651 RepID=A0A7C8VFZ5_ORBOL|nr:hypothetical protein TWF970_010813 [Orbilia oligospora]